MSKKICHECGRDVTKLNYSHVWDDKEGLKRLCQNCERIWLCMKAKKRLSHGNANKAQ